MFVNFCFADVLGRNCFDQPKRNRYFNRHLVDNNRTSDGYIIKVSKRSKCKKQQLGSHCCRQRDVHTFILWTCSCNKHEKYFKLICKTFDGDVADISPLTTLALLRPIASPRGPLITYYTSLRMERFDLSGILLPRTQCSCVILIVLINLAGSGSRSEERRTVNQGDGDSIPPAAVSKLSFTSYCLCLLGETLKGGGLFYLVSTPGEVKRHTQGINV